MSTQHDTWLAKTPEDALEPDLPICDPHHHLWDMPDHPDRHYLLPELIRDTTAGHNVVRTVFVDCMSHYRTDGPEEMRPVGETEFARKVAEESATSPGAEIAGLVGFADMTLGERVMPVLEAHLEAGGGRFRGIRHATGWDPSPDIGAYRNSPPGLLLDPTFREGAACLDRLGLSFDAIAYPHQLLEVASLARALPGLTIVLNHTGQAMGIGPYEGKRDEVFRYWQAGMAELAQCDNVYVKLGGLGMPTFGFGWHTREVPASSLELAEGFAQYHLACIKLFGANRCMFESNFPVDRVSCSYTVLWNAFKRVAEGLSAAEKAEVFHDAAARAYRLCQ